jgi:hypothetical protein
VEKRLLELARSFKEFGRPRAGKKAVKKEEGNNNQKD